jgi:hypothetical protein
MNQNISHSPNVIIFKDPKNSSNKGPEIYHYTEHHVHHWRDLVSFPIL